MIGRQAEKVLNRAVRFAVDLDHEYFTLEHVLWSLLKEKRVQETILACAGNAQQLRTDIETYLRKEVSTLKRGLGSEEPHSHPVATLGIQRLIQRALFQVQSAGK